MASPSNRATKWFVWILFFCHFLLGSTCRIGEAKTPGPPAQDSGDWSFGVCNPSGLHGKAMLVSGIKADIIAVSETHHTSVSKSMFQRSLKAHSAYKYVVTGAPLPPRSQGSDAVAYSGVAVISTEPSRALCSQWPPDLFETGRVQITGTLIHNCWVTGGTIYGYPQGKSHINAQERTEAILDHMIDHLTIYASGPRYLCGDWNFEPSQLQATQKLLACGWQEVQSMEFQRTGTAPQATCKKKTQKDVLWMSPELAAMFVGLRLEHDRFADHSVLIASFASGPQFSVRYLWPIPVEVPWEQVDIQPPPIDFSHGDPSSHFGLLWHGKEETAKTCLKDRWKPSMGGRGQRLHPIKRKGWATPPKLGRSKDHQPQFLGFDVQHCRWLKQLRRLQNYHNWACSHFGTHDPAILSHGVLLWHSILRATGFCPTFQQWWCSRSVHGLSDPGYISDFHPPPDVACVLCEVFCGEVRCLERALSQAKKAGRKHAIKTDPNLVFQDTKRPVPEPVSSLLISKRAKVVHLDVDNVAAEIEPPMDFCEFMPLRSPHGLHKIIHATEDKMFLETLQGIEVGDVLSQSKPVGALDAVFEAFHEQWKLRWCRHDGLPHSHWQAIVDFAKTHMPFAPVNMLKLDNTIFKAEAARKNKHAATGMDGISRKDIMQCDDSTLTSLRSMFDRAATDGQWPTQVITGRVASLAKVPDACETGQYRPITVFSLVYRLFSSLHARHLLRWADGWCHSDIFGNRQNHRTVDLWRTLTNDIQTAQDPGACLSGLTADVEKAFNCLPRWVILAAASVVGAPEPLVTAWCGAMAGMKRRFKVRDSVSEGFETSTGLAEGCALSCFGMLLLDDLMHRFIHFTAPSVRVLSFVDNWDLLTWDHSMALRQLDLLLDFASKVDLTVDKKKTFGWSTDPLVRKELRKRHIPVLHHAKDLGAHVAFTRQRTNRTVQDRLDALDTLWHQIKTCKGSYALKVRLLRAVAWPRGLFGVASAPVGSAIWLKHRRKAVQALHADKAGVNPTVLLGVVESLADPQLLALLATVRESRELCPYDFWSAEVFPHAVGLVTCAPSSPVAVLVERIQQVGITVHADGSWSDSFGPFHPARVNYAELEMRLQWQWYKYVGQQVAHRPDFLHFGRVDVCTTRKALAPLPPDQQAVMRGSLSGALFTQNAHDHWNHEGGHCKWCGCQDSLQHRYFECVQTQELRTSLAPLAVSCRNTLPDVLALRGWAVQPPSHQCWIRQLCSLPTSCPDLQLPLTNTGWNYVFTDGSCFWQTHQSYRVAAWGAVLAVPFSHDWTFAAKGVLGSGVLSGLCQTAFRAELYALAFVLHHAAAQNANVVIYSDCLGVVNRFHLLTRGNMRLKPNTKNADLWEWILTSMHALGNQKVVLRKTEAHKPVSAARTRYEAWRYWNNAAADQVARLANLQRPKAFWDLWTEHVRQVHGAALLHDQIWKLHLAVAMMSVRGTQETTQDERPDVVVRPQRVFQQGFDMSGWDGNVPLPFSQEYGAAMAHRISVWWHSRTKGGAATQVQWISLAHLYIDYQLSWGCPGPVKFRSQWLDATQRRYLDPEKHNLLQRLKWFKRCIKLFWKLTSQVVNTEICRCEGEVIQSFVNAASVRWDMACFQLTEEWLARTLTTPCARGSVALTNLPIAEALPGMRLGHGSPNGDSGIYFA